MNVTYVTTYRPHSATNEDVIDSEKRIKETVKSESRLSFILIVVFIGCIVFSLMEINAKIYRIEQKIDRLAIELGYTKGEI